MTHLKSVGSQLDALVLAMQMTANDKDASKSTKDQAIQFLVSATSNTPDYV